MRRENYDIPLSFTPMTVQDWHKARDCYEWFASRFLFIADKEADAPHRFFFNYSQRYLQNVIRQYRNDYGGGNYLIYKARQEGMSTWISNYFAWNTIRHPGFKAMTMAHEKIATENLLSMIKLSYNALEDYYMLPNGIEIPVRPREKASNRKELHVYFDDKGIQDSRVIIEEATAGGEAAISFALNAIHYSEVGKKAFDDGKAIGASLQTLSRNGIALAEGTADGAYGWMYETWLEAEDDFELFKKRLENKPSLKYNGWVPIFLPWFFHYSIPLEEGEVIEPENEWETQAMTGENTYQHHKCTPEQIKAMRWIMATRLPKTLERSPDEWRKQEYPSNPAEGFLVSGSSWLNTDIIAHGMAWSREYTRDKKLLTIGDGWRFIRKPEPDKYKYVIGGDVAEGLETGDWDTCIVIEVRPNGPNWVIGMWRKHEDDKATHAAAVTNMANMLNASVVAIENNLHGYAVNDHLQRQNCRGLYVRVPDDVGSFAVGYEKRYGWHTDGKSRGIMLGQLGDVLMKWHLDQQHPEGLVIPFPEIWNEIRSFVKINKKAQASAGNHDDLVMATGIANSVAYDITPKYLGSTSKKPDNLLVHLNYMGMKGTADFLKKFNRRQKHG